MAKELNTPNSEMLLCSKVAQEAFGPAMLGNVPKSAVIGIAPQLALTLSNILRGTIKLKLMIVFMLSLTLFSCSDKKSASDKKSFGQVLVEDMTASNWKFIDATPYSFSSNKCYIYKAPYNGLILEYTELYNYKKNIVVITLFKDSIDKSKRGGIVLRDDNDAVPVMEFVRNDREHAREKQHQLDLIEDARIDSLNKIKEEQIKSEIIATLKQNKTK